MLLALASASAGSAQDRSNPLILPPAVREAQAGKHFKVAVTSTDGRMAQLLRSAFSAHGGFTVVEAPEAQFTFRIDPGADNRAALRIFSGQPPQLLHEESFRADSAVRAVLRAADRSVERTLGLPGFFAGELLFTSDRAGGGKTDVYRSDLFFQSVRQVTRDGSVALTPRWSPDGQSVLYTSYHRSGFPDVFKVTLATGRREVFAAYKGTNQGAAFSPDGRTVAMILSAPGNPELYIAQSTGQNLKRLTENASIEQSPTWSPDGQRLAYVSDRLGGPQLYVMGLESRQERRIPTNISGYCAEPAWNPLDPTRLLFTGATSGSYQIGLFDFQTAKARFLTKGPGDSVEATWTNDGRHAVFTRRSGDGQTKRLFLLDTLTGKTTALHSARFGNASQPAFAYRP
ncbi:MAG: biopolymer transporter Tol [Opitutales bacterium]